KRPSSNLGDCLWVQFPPVLLKLVSAGQKSDFQFHVAEVVRGPMPTRHGSLTTSATARSSIGERTPAPQAGRMGSIPIRAIWPSGGTVDTRRSERRAEEAWEFDSPLGHCGVDWSLVPARSHEPSDAGSNPASATFWPSTQIGKAARS